MKCRYQVNIAIKNGVKMLRTINIILATLVGLGVYFVNIDTENSEKQEEVVEIYPGDTGDRYDDLLDLFGSEKASTE